MYAVCRSLPWSWMFPLLLSAGIAQGRDLPFEAAAAPVDTDATDIALSLPAPDGYHHLRDALPSLLALQRAGGWPALPAGPWLRPGDVDARIPLFRQRLILGGDLATEGLESAAQDPLRYDDDLAAAMRRFQSRHGLDIDGIVGPRTLAALNVPVEQRLAQILVNLERWRAMPPDDGTLRLIVNIPGFSAELRRGDEVLKSARVIVGRASRPTPELATRITHLVVNPTWTVPERIARLDVLPKLRDDPGYLDRGGFRVLAGWNPDARSLDPDAIDWDGVTGRFPFVLRQAPGPANALGTLKFEMPNPYSVYLHDTPDRALFARSTRAFSSGCIRVEGIHDLAEWLAAASGWERGRLEAEIRSGQTRHLRLSQPVEVRLVYLTAWVNNAGTLEFRDDIYDRDAALPMRL